MNGTGGGKVCSQIQRNAVTFRDCHTNYSNKHKNEGQLNSDWNAVIHHVGRYVLHRQSNEHEMLGKFQVSTEDIQRFP